MHAPNLFHCINPYVTSSMTDTTPQDCPITWQRVQELIKTNDIHLLYRTPENLVKYRKWKQHMKDTNMDLATYLLVHELKWCAPGESIKESRNKMLTREEDVKILINDFPYNFEEGVVHLVVWSKVGMKPDPKSELGDIPLTTKRIIGKYVEKTFHDKLGISMQDLCWFKNYAKLQSVRAISHVHVLVRGMTKKQLDMVLYTSGEVLTDEEYLECE